MVILPSCSHVGTIVWLHFNETPGEKARRELHKDASCCFEKILEIVLHKTTAG